MTERVVRRDHDGCCTLELNRPDKLNALDNGTFEELKAHIDALSQDGADIACVLLRGAGKAFCAGADLAAMSGSATPLPPTYKPAVIDSLARLPMPTIAAVHGVCFTG
ncbi:MAG TPA: enoyl-CoA hydratase/isomerase family protein, partial [Novosphingobium sp.]